MKQTHLFANESLDIAFTNLNGIFSGKVKKSNLKNALREAKNAGHNTICIMIDSELKNIGRVAPDKMMLHELHFLVGVDVPVSEIASTINAWRGRTNNAFLEVDLL